MKSDRLQQLFQFLEQAPDDAFTLYSIAYEYLQQGKLEQAMDYFTRLRIADPDYVGLYYHLGKTYEQMDRYDRALEVYEDGIAVAKQQHDLHAYQELQRAKQQAMDELEGW